MAPKTKYHKRPDGLYETTRTDPRTKKRIHFYGKSAREIDKQILAYATRKEEGRLFQEVAEEWREQHFPTLAHNTLSGYRPATVRAIEAFGNQRIRQVKPQDIGRYITDFARGGRSRKTVTTQLLILNLICSHAVREGDIEHNPCTHIQVPKGLKKGHREAATPQEEAAIKAKADGWLFPFFILFTGLRRSEALALTWDDVDLADNLIHITKSIYQDGGKTVVKSPKSAAGYRTVPILNPLKARLEQPPKKSEEVRCSLVPPHHRGRPPSA